MKKFIISEEEKSRILGMHQEETKRYYLGEQSAITAANTNTQDTDNKKHIYNQYLDKVNEFVPYDGKELRNMLTTLESGTKEGGNINDLDVIQPFFKQNGQKFIQKVNPGGYNQLTSSGFENYESLLFNTSCSSCKKSSVYKMILKDVLSLKSGLTFKAQEKAGYAVKTPSWLQQAKAKAVIERFSKEIKLS